MRDWHAAVAQDFKTGLLAVRTPQRSRAFFGDVAKDVVKDQAKKVIGALIDKLLKP